MNSQPACLLRRPSEILVKLLVLSKHQCPIQVLFAAGDTAWLVHILHIDQSEKKLYLDIIDESYTPIDTHCQLSIEFKSEFLGAKISFHTTKIESVLFKNAPAYRIPIPDSLTWIEARDYHRMEIPLSSPCFCSFMVNESTSVQFKIADISLIGFSLLCDCPEVFQLLQPNTIFQGCRIQLGDMYEGIVSFEIRHNHILHNEASDDIEKIGCKFTHITQTFENHIQKYVQDLELARRQQASD